MKSIVVMMAALIGLIIGGIAFGSNAEAGWHGHHLSLKMARLQRRADRIAHRQAVLSSMFCYTRPVAVVVATDACCAPVVVADPCCSPVVSETIVEPTPETDSGELPPPVE